MEELFQQTRKKRNTRRKRHVTTTKQAPRNTDTRINNTITAVSNYSGGGGIKLNKSPYEFDYLQVTLEVLKSLALDVRVKKHIGSVIVETLSLTSASKKQLCSRNYSRIVTWPTVWEGIQRQLEVDLPRQEVYINGARWFLNDNVFALERRLDGLVGTIWCRWICAFLGQSIMADVFSVVWKHYQERYGTETILCECQHNTTTPNDHTRNNNALQIYISTTGSIGIRFRKNFRLLHLGPTDFPQKMVSTMLEMSIFPNPRLVLSWYEPIVK